MTTTRVVRSRRRWRKRHSPVPKSAGFFRPLIAYWFATLVIVALAVGSSMFFSMRVTTRYEAVAHFSLRTTRPGLRIQQLLNRRLPAVSTAVHLGLHNPEVEVLAQPGNADVAVVVSAPHDEQLVYVANTYASEFTAWELGPEQRRINGRYRRLLAAADNLPPTDPRYSRLEAQLDKLRPHVVTDSLYRAAAAATKTTGPEPLTRSAVALGVGLLLALAITRRLDADERKTDS